MNEKDKKIKISLSLDAELLELLDEIREERKMTRNALISFICRDWVQKTSMTKKVTDTLTEKLTDKNFILEVAKIMNLNDEK